jgi:iron complex transport system permease protein
MPAIKIVLDITRLVEEGKLTAQEAERLQALAKRDTGSLAINVLMSFGAVAVAAGIIALDPDFATGAALGVALVAIGLGISFFADEQWAFSAPPQPSSARSCWQAGSSGL